MRMRALSSADRRGASEVVGVILMVAITVIIASAIGAFVLGTGDRTTDTVPQASFSYDFDDRTNVTITHEGGESIDNETIRVTVDDTPGFPNPESSIDTADGWNDTIESGDSLELYNATEGADIAERGDTVRIIWDNPSGEASNELSTSEWP